MRRVGWAVVCAVTMALSMAASSPASATPSVFPSTRPRTTQPLSLFIQVSSLAPRDPATVASWLDRFCRSEPNRPHELVLQDVVGSDGALADRYLDVIAPRLPGGSASCTSSAFIGTADVRHPGGSRYGDRVLDPAWRATYLATTRTASRAFKTRYPFVRAGWYLDVEANLNEFYYDDIAAGYGTLLAAELDDLSRVTPGAPVLWAPAFWYPYHAYHSNLDGMASLTRNIAQVFASLQTHARGITRIDIQDFVGGSSCQPVKDRVTPADAVAWVRFLAAAVPSADIRVDVERFTLDCTTGGTLAAPALDVLRRERVYSSAGVTLGASFEMRYWVR